MDEFGRIHYDSLVSSGTIPAETAYAYTPPPQARYWRVYYGFNDIPAGNMTIYGMNETIDARCGEWATYVMSFNKLVSIDPGIEYAFRISLFDGYNALPNSSGFELLNGDIAFSFNVRDHLQKKFGEMRIA